ncbi:MAG TPA: response regulator transcription factor [Candidatus Acidoferrum sp.]|nr:response regulator transcription factor [Candidatus Acidoferrum sp.]
MKAVSPVKILVVEDEKGMAQVLRRGLEEDNHAVSLAYDGLSAISLAEDSKFDLVLLDVMLPGLDGIQVARRFRELRQDIPILMLTARDSVPDIVKGLDSGADDYMTKPFSFAVLLARIRALERRVVEPRTHTLRVCDLALEITQRRVFRGTREVHLTPTEFRLLEFLMRHEGRVASRHAILDTVWGPSENIEENTLDAFVRLLRRKVDENEPIKLIHTVRGFGYSLGPEA